MFKRILLILLFILGFYKAAYADPITIGIAVSTFITGTNVLGGWFIATVIVVKLAIVATVGFAIFSSVRAAMQADKLRAQSSKYSSPIIDNTFSNEGVVPLIYGGPIIMGGNLLWQSDPGTTVSRFLGICIGEISAITNVCIDDQPIEELPGCNYTAYLGTNSQLVDSRSSDIVKGLRDIAYIAATITAGEKVSSNPVISARITGRKIQTWNVGSGNWTTNALSSSKNPAAIIRDYMLLSRVVGGCGIPESFVDPITFGEFYVQCAELIDNGNGGTEARYELDIAIDTRHSALDNLDKMLITCNAKIIRSGALYKIAFEKSGETAVMAFTEDNITKGTFVYGYGKSDSMPNKVGVEWISPLESKNPKRVAWAEDELDQDIRGMIDDKIECYGIIRQSQASRLANKLLYEGKLADIWCEFEANMSAMHCEPFDVVSVTHSRPNWTAAPFRIIDVTETDFGRAKYTLVSYNSSIVNDKHGSTFDDWDYGSPPNPFEAVTDVTNIVLAEVGWQNADGAWVAHIDVSWTAPATKKELLDSYIIELKKDTGNYITVGSAPATATNYRININLETDKTYYVKIKTKSINNIISSGSTSAALTLLGKESPPDNVANFSYTFAKELVFKWNKNDDLDLLGYEIRTEDANWGVQSAALIYRGLTNTFTITTPASRNPGVYYIKAYDRSGNYSFDAQPISPTNVAPAAPILTMTQWFGFAKIQWTDVADVDLLNYQVYKSNTNAWAGEESLYATVPGTQVTVQGNAPVDTIADAVDANSITDADLIAKGTNYFVGDIIKQTSGTYSGQETIVTAFNTATGQVSVASWPLGTPSVGDKFVLKDRAYFKVRGVDTYGAGVFSAAVTIDFTPLAESEIGDAIISARKLIAGEIITLSAQIKDAIIQNAHIISLSGDKITAQSITLTKLAPEAIPPKTYYQNDAPTSGMNEGDYWIDTDDSNKLYIYQSSTWTVISASGSGGVTTFRQATVPTATSAGDLWIDSDDSKLYRATNAGDDQVTAGEWVLVDAAVATGWAHTSDTTKIDGGDIYTGSITADKITVSQLDALVANTGTLSVDEHIDVGDYVVIDGVNSCINVYDDAGTPVLRVKMGKLS